MGGRHCDSLSEEFYEGILDRQVLSEGEHIKDVTRDMDWWGGLGDLFSTALDYWSAP